MTRLLAIATTLLLIACGSTSPDPPDTPRDLTEPEPIGGAAVGGGPGAPPATDDATWEGDEEAEAQQGQTCTTTADCPQGLMCFGPEGCDREWICVEPRPCTRDLVEYCACDGTAASGSGSCPPRPYSHRGPC